MLRDVPSPASALGNCLNFGQADIAQMQIGKPGEMAALAVQGACLRQSGPKAEALRWNARAGLVSGGMGHLNIPCADG
jgi:hypothetical protein